VLQALGVAENTKKLTVADLGRSIPDALSKDKLVEVKLVTSAERKVSLTRQLQIQIEAARQSGRQFVLVVNKGAAVNEALRREVGLNGGTILTFDPINKTFLVYANVCS
jgi:hypothetical protein